MIATSTSLWTVAGGAAALLGIFVVIAGIGWRGLSWLQRVDAKLGVSNGRGNVTEMLTHAILNAEEAKVSAAEAKQAAADLHADTTARFDAQDRVLRDHSETLRSETSRIERLDRGQVETHQLIVGLTNAQAQSAVALAINSAELGRLTTLVTADGKSTVPADVKVEIKTTDP